MMGKKTHLKNSTPICDLKSSANLGIKRNVLCYNKIHIWQVNIRKGQVFPACMALWLSIDL